MKEEINQIITNKTYTLVPLPSDRKAIPCKWVYKIKYDMNGNISKYKARLVVKGFHQREGRDYNETFAPVMKYVSLRILLAIATIQDLEIQQLDVDSAFLNAKLNEVVYMQQPEGFIEKGKEHLVCKLNKALYGLKQAPNAWNGDIDQTLIGIGFYKCHSDACVYFKPTKSNKMIIIGLFVDDVLILYHKQDEQEWFKIKEQIKLKYKIKDLGDASYILNMKITRDRPNKLLYLDQQNYIDKILNRFNMNECKTVTTPCVDLKLLKSDDNHINELNDELKNTYQQITGSALYAGISTRPDIAFAVGVASRYNSKPQLKHLSAAKRIYRYLNGTKSLVLLMDGKVQNSTSKIPILSAYTDSDYAGDPEERKSTSGYVIKLNNCPIHWMSKKQSTIARSTCEAEIIALGEAVKELQWINNFLIELKLYDADSRDPAILYCDNKSTVTISKEDLANTKTKHIAVNYYFIKQALNDGLVQYKWIQSDDQVADIFTKPLGKNKFNHFKFMLMGEC